MPSQDLRYKALHYAIDWTGQDSPAHLAAMMENRLTQEHLQEFDSRRSRFLPCVESVFFGIAIQHLKDSGSLIDRTTLAARFRQGALATLARTRGEEVPAIWAQAQIVDAEARKAGGNGSEVKWLVHQLKDDCQRKKLTKLLGETARNIGDEDPHALTERLIQAGLSLQGADTEDGAVFPVAERIDERRAQYLERELDEKIARGVETGFTTFDNITWGLRPGEVVLVTGQTKVGKSQFRQKMFHTMWQNGHSVLDVLREYDSRMARLRLECMHLSSVGVSNNGTGFSLMQAIDRGKLNGEQKVAYFKALDEFSNNEAAYLFVEPNHYSNLDEIEGIVSTTKKEYGIEVLGIDDLHNQRLGQHKNDRDDLQQGYLMAFLKDLAHRYNLIVIAEVQEPRHLATHGIVNPADAVMYSSKFAHKTDLLIRLFRPLEEQAGSHKVEAQILAHRTSRSRYNFNLFMDPSVMDIHEERAGMGNPDASLAAKIGSIGDSGESGG